MYEYGGSYMHILSMKQIVVVILKFIEEQSVDVASWIQAIVAILSLILGVFTIFVGKRYILSKRQNAKVGFYVDLLIFIKRFRSLLNNHEGITAYLIDDTYRNDSRFVTMPAGKAEKFKPIFMKLCDEFLDYISKAENNIAPEYSGKDNITEKEEWNKWYAQIMIVVLFVEKCKFINQDMCVYISDEQVTQYVTDYDNFTNALEYLESELQRAIDYPESSSHK